MADWSKASAQALVLAALVGAVPVVGHAAPIFSSAYAGKGGCGPLHGDINGSGSFDVTDAQCAALAGLAALGNAAVPGCVASAVAADPNCDGWVNVVDVILVVARVQGLPLSAKIDADANQCPDACADNIPLVPAFGGPNGANLVTVGTSANKLLVPRDLEFHPDRPWELWAVNRGDDSVVIFFDPATPKQKSEWRKDLYGNHFMEEVSSLAFGANDTFGTCQESQNTYDGKAAPNNFMGPALWPAALNLFAKVNQTPGSLLGSHLDMLHESPLCMGIAHQSANVYWAFDGFHGFIMRYDFQAPHGLGEDDHSDGIVRQYPEAKVTRSPNVPSHMVLDKVTGWLYVADTGASRVFRLQTKSGKFKQAVPFAQWIEPLKEYSIMQEVTVEVLVTKGLVKPSGIALDGDVLFVSDHSTGDIVAFSLTGQELDRLATGAAGIMGIEIGLDGRLWYVNGAANKLVLVDP